MFTLVYFKMLSFLLIILYRVLEVDLLDILSFNQYVACERRPKRATNLRSREK